MRIGRAKKQRAGADPRKIARLREFADATGILEDHAEPGGRHRRPGRDERGTHPPLSGGEPERRRNRCQSLGQRASETRGVLLRTGSFECGRVDNRRRLRTRSTRGGIEFGDCRPHAVYPVTRSPDPRRQAVSRPTAAGFSGDVGTEPAPLVHSTAAGRIAGLALPHDPSVGTARRSRACARRARYAICRDFAPRNRQETGKNPTGPGKRIADAAEPPTTRRTACRVT